MQRMVLVIMALFSTAAAADSAEEGRCREIGFSKSVETRDPDAFRSFVDADARFISNRPRRGVDEIAEGWSGFMAEDGPGIRWRPLFFEVLEDGNLAFSVGLYEYVGKDETGAVRKSYGSFHSTWRLNDDGVWRVVFDAGDPWAREPAEEERAVLNAEDSCEE